MLLDPAQTELVIKEAVIAAHACGPSLIQQTLLRHATITVIIERKHGPYAAARKTCPSKAQSIHFRSLLVLDSGLVIFFLGGGLGLGITFMKHEHMLSMQRSNNGDNAGELSPALQV